MIGTDELADQIVDALIAKIPFYDDQGRKRTEKYRAIMRPIIKEHITTNCLVAAMSKDMDHLLEQHAKMSISVLANRVLHLEKELSSQGVQLVRVAENVNTLPEARKAFIDLRNDQANLGVRITALERLHGDSQKDA